MGNLRFLFLVGLLVLAALLCRTEVSWGVVLIILLLGLLLTGIWHIRIEEARSAARRGIRFYQSGLERLDGTWPGKGSPGTEFLDPHHPYAADLDIFGVGSLFELVDAAHTQIGRTTLAAWFLEPAVPPEILARQSNAWPPYIPGSLPAITRYLRPSAVGFYCKLKSLSPSKPGAHAPAQWSNPPFAA